MILICKRKGGAEIVENDYHENSNTLNIYFKDKKTVDFFVNLSAIEMYGEKYPIKKLDFKNNIVTQNEKVKNNSDKVLRIEIDSSDYEKYEKNALQLYLEALLGHENFEFKKLDYEIDKLLNLVQTSFTVIVFAKSIDINRITKKHAESKTLLGNNVFWELIDQPNSVVAISQEHQDTVKLYLSNHGKSGGGPIKILKTIETTDPMKKLYLIQYENIECVERVAKKVHKDIEIKILYEDIIIFESKIKKSTETKSFKELNVDEFPFSFISKNKLYLDLFEKELLKYNAKLIVDLNKTQIEYYSKKLQETELEEIIKKYKNMFTFRELENIPKDKDVIEKLKDNLSNLYKNSNSVDLIFLNSENVDNFKIRIECLTEKIDLEWNKVIQIVQNDNNKKIEDLSNLKPYQCSLLMKNDFIKQCKATYPDVKITIAPNKGTVTIDGFFQSILFCKQKMWELLNQISKKESEISFFMAYFMIECREYVEDVIEKEKCKCEYIIEDYDDKKIEKNEFCKLALFSLDFNNDLFKTKNLMSENFIEWKFDLKRESESLLTDFFENLVSEIKKDLQKLQKEDTIVFLPKQYRKVCCVGEKNVVRNTTERIKNFFEQNTIYENEIKSLCQEDLKYLNIVIKHEIEKIKSKDCTVEFLEIEQELKLKIRSNKDNFHKVEKNIKELLTRKIIDFYETETCVIDHFTEDKSKKKILEITEKETG